MFVRNLSGLSGVGLDYATRPGGIGADQYYENVANWIFANNPTGPQLAEAMQTWGVTPEDVATAMARRGSDITPQDVATATGIAAQRPAPAPAPTPTPAPAPVYVYEEPVTVAAPAVYTASSGLSVSLDIAQRSAAQKIAFYAQARALGYSDDQIRDAAEDVAGPQSDADWAYLRDAAGYPAPAAPAPVAPPAPVRPAVTVPAPAPVVTPGPVEPSTVPGSAVTLPSTLVEPAPAAAPAGGNAGLIIAAVAASLIFGA